MSESSPLLLKATSDDIANERTDISLYREVLSLVLSKVHWLLLFFALLFFMLAGAALSSFFIVFEKLAEVSQRKKVMGE